MEILEFLQNIRTPFLDNLNLLITNLGSELVVIAVICALYWCVNKKLAYRLGFVYFISGLAVQTVKLIYKIPRPWVLSEGIQPVDKALEGATGYSFPSGHTQSATAFYGTIAHNTKSKGIQALMLFFILSVAFSRMYLGVHTPMDVSVSLILTLLIIIGCNYAIDKKMIYKLRQEVFTGILLMIPMAMLVYGTVQVYTGSIDIENSLDYFKSAGAAVGFIAGWYLETNYLKFDEKQGNIVSKVCRYVLGVAMLLGLKSGLKVLIGDGIVAGFVRYAITIFFGIYVYPLVFCKVNEKMNNKK